MDSGDRFVTESEEDQSGPLWIVTVLFLLFSTTALGARFFSKHRAGVKFTKDDFVSFGAYVS